MILNRRQFAGAGLASFAFAGVACAPLQAPPGPAGHALGYGPLLRDPKGLFDLPAGFEYTIVSSAGDPMDDGYVVPDKFDGMGCFPVGAHRVALVRNHELEADERSLGPTRGIPALDRRLEASGRVFGRDTSGGLLPAGTTTLVYDTRSGRREQQFLSLSGTALNCAGGATPWGTWLSCEEWDEEDVGAAQSHGWVFEVPAAHKGLVAPVPLKDLGRFCHEAAAVDPRTGIVYLTEDKNDGLFYRFIPAQPGRLASGGRLQALGFKDGTRDTRNWDANDFAARAWKETVWIDLDQTDSPNDDLRMRGHQGGGALFARGEGIHHGTGEFYFTCTSGGAAKVGQIMRYRPSPREGQPDEGRSPGRLQLFVESTDAAVLDYGDNLTVSPWGHLIVCEDRSDGEINHLKGVTPNGDIYTVARLNADTELAGVCFSPDGGTMFVNVYKPGKTLAIRGPWSRLASA